MFDNFTSSADLTGLGLSAISTPVKGQYDTESNKASFEGDTVWSSNADDSKAKD